MSRNHVSNVSLSQEPLSQWDTIDLFSVNGDQTPFVQRPLETYLADLDISRVEPERKPLTSRHAFASRIVSSSPQREQSFRIPEDKPRIPEKRMSRTLDRSRALSCRSTSSNKPNVTRNPVVVPASRPVADQRNVQPTQVDQDRYRTPPSGIKPPKFKEGNSLKSYLMRFEDYLSMATVNPQDVRGILLNCLKCDATYDRIRRLKFSQEEMANPHKLLQFIRDAILNDAAIAETNRLELKDIKQEEYESVSDFAERIHRAAELAFPGESDDRVNANKIDALQDGLHDRDVAKDVCDWKKQDVAFETLVAEAERAATQNKIFKRGGADSGATIYAIRNDGPRMSQNQPFQRKSWNPCKFCKKTNHTEANCRFKITCQICGQDLHEARNCPVLASTIQTDVNPMQNQQTMNFRPQTFTTGNRRQATPSVPGTREHDRANGLCYVCHQNGHLSRNCQNRGWQLNERAVGDFHNADTHQNSGRAN